MAIERKPPVYRHAEWRRVVKAVEPKKTPYVVYRFSGRKITKKD